MKRILVISFTLLLFCIGIFSQDVEDDHEYAAIKQEHFDYFDWKYNDAITGKPINLRQFSQGKKLVMVFYLAPWCHNSRYELIQTEKLYQKYKNAGFAVIGVSLYGDKERTARMFEVYGATFPVVVESESSKDRKKTPHYKYRRKMKDDRKWGTPWIVYLKPDEFETGGTLLTKNPFVAAGETTETDAVNFIEQVFKKSKPTYEN
ncbi:MAG: TlpA disulfide reductase family protein [Pyrinomonadaceae bacterium]